MAHGNRPPPSSGVGVGGKCPFRAALQAQSLQTSASAESTTAGAVANKATAKEEEAVEEKEEGKTACKCAAGGLQPRGEFQKSCDMRCLVYIHCYKLTTGR